LIDPHIDRIYQEVLKSLLTNGLRFVVIGTYGLWLRLGRFSNHRIKDCDLVIENSSPNIELFTKRMLELSWQVRLWNEPIGIPIDTSLLKGKYYLRATRDRLVIDATYECEYIEWEDISRHSSKFNSVPVASIEHILKLKRIRGGETDWKIIEEIDSYLLNKEKRYQ
jgi:hypothetical protein